MTLITITVLVAAILDILGLAWIGLLVAATLLVLLDPRQDWLLDIATSPLRLLRRDRLADDIHDAVCDAADAVNAMKVNAMKANTRTRP
jgi:hypothetical protein